MEIIDLNKTLEKCEAHWRASQRSSSYKYTVFNPVYVGENYNGEIEGVNTQNTGWYDDEIITFNNAGWDTVDGQIDWNECPVGELYDDIKIYPEYFDELEDGTYDLTEDQEQIIREWKEEQIDAELDVWWTCDNDLHESPAIDSEKAIRRYAERHNLEIVK